MRIHSPSKVMEEYFKYKSMHNNDLLVSLYKQPITKKYKFLEEIGRGASGICFKVMARDDPKQYYCVKKILKKEIPVSKQTNEIDLLDQLHHPDIVRLYELFEDTNAFYMVLDFCEGGELFDYLDQKGTLSEKQTKELFHQIISSVKYCHKMNISHRDLKPQNFLIFEKCVKGEVPNLKLIDFDLGFKWENSMEKEVKEKEGHRIIGSPYYIAPEILEGEYDQRCDIWSAGVILFMMVSGVPPFDGDTNNQIIQRIQKKKYRMDIPEMSHASLLLKDLIQKILVSREKRITIEGIFQHPWMQICPKKAQVSIDFSNLLKFSKFSKLKEIAATYIASKMTSKETKNLDRAFREIDQNKDGFLSVEELRTALISTKVNKNQMENLLNFVEIDKNGTLNYSQFVASTLKHQTITCEQNLKRVFNMIDRDNSGYIDREELISILNRYDDKRKSVSPENIDNQIVDVIFKNTDKNNDGKIDFQEFVDRICCSLK